jgi:hypothetical protein
LSTEEPREEIERLWRENGSLREEIGRLTAIAERVQGLDQERDELVKQLAGAQAALENKIIEEVRTATTNLSAEYEQARVEWTKERGELRARIEVLEKRPEPGRIAGDLPTDQLAEHFRGVLESLAAPPPPEGRHFAAALTGLEVEARGVLAAAEGEEPLRLVPVDPEVAAKADLNLSTVRMRFGLLPEIAPEGRSEP